MHPRTNSLLLVFTRNPELGKCKTRLAKTVGDTIALDIYKFLLHHTAKITANLPLIKQVYYSEEIWENDIWNPDSYQKKLQKGEDLGARMLAAFQQGFDEGFKKIVIIGSDMYDLSGPDLEHAFALLDHHDYVIGPAQDGGYYLLGMKKCKTVLFQNKAWGTATVLQDTLDELNEENHAVLEVRNDVDRYEDIKDIPVFQQFLKH
ncbi:MAG: TIGR04282 family arsenosugar biosynthesis glycosyltransferase [Bacteroidota bacterium]